MAVTITRAYGWECGNAMIPDADLIGGVSVGVSASAAYTGSYGLSCPDGGVVFEGGGRLPIDGNPTNPSFSCWTKHEALTRYQNDDSMRLGYQLDGGEYIELRWNSATKTLDLYIDDALEEAGTIEVSSNTWFHVQFYLVVDGVAGSAQVKIDGHESINKSGIDTAPGTSTTANYVAIRRGTYSSTNKVYVDDLVIGSGGYLGDLRCPDIRPNADTAQDDWTPSSGSDNYAMIDESPASDADYNETDTDAHADELDMTDFDGTTYIPVAVTAWARARQDAGVGDGIHVGIDSNGTEDQSASQPLSNSWEYYYHTADDNPDDAAEWEDADIDALKLRYESDIP